VPKAPFNSINTKFRWESSHPSDQKKKDLLGYGRGKAISDQGGELNLQELEEELVLVSSESDLSI
jgi:hypothetical protein